MDGGHWYAYLHLESSSYGVEEIPDDDLEKHSDGLVSFLGPYLTMERAEAELAANLKEAI
jgi:hypothetical protein